MKTKKNFFVSLSIFITVVFVLALFGQQGKPYKEIWDKLNEHETRITSLEEIGPPPDYEERIIALEETASTLGTQMANANSNISSLQSTLDAAQSKIDALETWKTEADNSIIDLQNLIEARYVGWVTQGTYIYASTTWTTIPGLQLNFSLDTEMAVTVRAFGTVRILGDAGAGFRFVIDGNYYGDKWWGERKVRGVDAGASTWISEFWYIERDITLPAGNHGVRVDMRTDSLGYVFQDSSPYTLGILKAEAR